MKLSLTNIWKSFGANTVVQDVSVDVPSGELFYLLGPSGCGKTTLLRMVAGFIAPDRGSVRIGEENVTSMTAQRRDTAMVFQNYALWPHMTVADNVAFGLQVRKVPRAERMRRVSEALEVVRMGGYERRKPHQLSGGQQQRVAFARALVVRPGVLLLDEPLSSLDARLRLEMRGEIRRICSDLNLTTLCVTHDQKEALAVADRMAVMADGVLAQLGRPSELYEKPADSRIASFLGECNIVKARAAGRESGRCRFETALGTIESSETDIDGACVLSIRPEAISLKQADDGFVNRLEGRITQRVYQGDTILLRIAIGSESLQVMLLADSDAARGLSDGPATCYIAPDHVHVMKE